MILLLFLDKSFYALYWKQIHKYGFFYGEFDTFLISHTKSLKDICEMYTENIITVV